ncbi:MAG: efflux RND transporter periplasmic adaptor subunit [Cyclobacteriaceae bacterium]|nr:efflux RND transporter periplasmic adaptor subunit [Cyclobacteriaceae bacterium]
MKMKIFPVLATGIILMGCTQKNDEAKEPPFILSEAMMQRSEFTVAHVEEAKNELRLFGKIAADNARQAQVYPVVSGNVLQISVELGDLVKQGQVLASVRSSEVADFQRQLLDARSDAAVAEKNLQVAKELYSGKLNSERDVTAATKELEKAKAELERITQVYSIYNLKEGSIFNITAPISGFIVSKDINRNEQLRSDKSDVIFSIAQIDEVWALANVNESDISKVAVGYDASVKTISYPNKLFKGKIDRIFNAIDPGTKAMKVLVRIPNQNLELKPEMNATIIVSYSENKKLIAIPSSAVIFDKSKNWVMVYTDRSHIETRQVEVYNNLGEITYLTSGLKDGETVISKNGLMIYDALND